MHLDLSTLQIPPSDVVPEPTAFDLAFCCAELTHYLDATSFSRGAILSRIICSLARLCRELEERLAASLDRERLSAANIGTINRQDKKIRELEAEIERLRKLPYGPDLPEKFHDE